MEDLLLAASTVMAGMGSFPSKTHSKNKAEHLWHGRGSPSSESSVDGSHWWEGR